MARVDAIIEGLQILDKYPHSDIAAEHDILYAGPGTLDVISDSDKSRLEELGWHVDDTSESYAIFV